MFILTGRWGDSWHDYCYRIPLQHNTQHPHADENACTRTAVGVRARNNLCAMFAREHKSPGYACCHGAGAGVGFARPRSALVRSAELRDRVRLALTPSLTPIPTLIVQAMNSPHNGPTATNRCNPRMPSSSVIFSPSDISLRAITSFRSRPWVY